MGTRAGRSIVGRGAAASAAAFSIVATGCGGTPSDEATAEERTEQADGDYQIAEILQWTDDVEVASHLVEDGAGGVGLVFTLHNVTEWPLTVVDPATTAPQVVSVGTIAEVHYRDLRDDPRGGGVTTVDGVVLSPGATYEGTAQLPDGAELADVVGLCVDVRIDIVTNTLAGVTPLPPTPGEPQRSPPSTEVVPDRGDGAVTLPQRAEGQVPEIACSESASLGAR